MSVIPKLLSDNGNSSANKTLAKLKDQMKQEITKEYEKTIQILQFLIIDEKDI